MNENVVDVEVVYVVEVEDVVEVVDAVGILIKPKTGKF